MTLNFAKFCYAFEKRLFFSATRKKIVLSCLKVNLEIYSTKIIRLTQPDIFVKAF